MVGAMKAVALATSIAMISPLLAGAVLRRSISVAPPSGKPGITAHFFGTGIPAQSNFTVYYYRSGSSKTALCSGNNGVSNSWSCFGKIPTGSAAGPVGNHTVSSVVTGFNTVNGFFYLCPASTLCVTHTSVTSSRNPATVNQIVTYTSHTASPIPNGGSARFTDNGTALPGCGAVPVNTTTGAASCKVTYKSSGTHSVIAKYSGNTSFTPSTSTPLKQTIH